MRRSIKALLIIAILLLVSIYLVNGYALTQREFDSEIGNTLKLINRAHEYGANITPYISMINNAIKLYEKGNQSQAIKIINYINNNLTMQLPELKSSHSKMLLRRNITVGILILIPPLSYFLIPYIYYNLWYKFRRDWIVEEADSNAR